MGRALIRGLLKEQVGAQNTELTQTCLGCFPSFSVHIFHDFLGFFGRPHAQRIVYLQCTACREGPHPPLKTYTISVPTQQPLALASLRAWRRCPRSHSPRIMQIGVFLRTAAIQTQLRVCLLRSFYACTVKAAQSPPFFFADTSACVALISAE